MRNEKLHAALARSTFSSQNAQNTTFSDHFWKLKNGTLLWRETHLQLKAYKTHHAWTSFAKCECHKMARSTCVSQNAQNTPCSGHFWNCGCQKIARGCGAKHICKSNVKNMRVLAHFLEVQFVSQSVSQSISYSAGQLVS